MKKFKNYIELLIACCISAAIAVLLNTGAAGFAAGLAAIAFIKER